MLFLTVVKFAMQMKGIKQQDLIPVLGTKGNVSKIMSSKVNIQLADLHPLNALLEIPLESLIPKDPTYMKSIGVTAEYVAEPESGFKKVRSNGTSSKEIVGKARASKRAATMKPHQKTKS